MKQTGYAVFWTALLLWTASCSNKTVIIEAESFVNRGGWIVDPQFQDVMESPYLLAHGLGNPVEDASTEVTLPHAGTWHVYVRTYDWTSPWTESEGPGKFELVIDGKSLGTFGTGCKSWQWQYAGQTETGTSCSVALHDLTGFDGRVDAVCFAEEPVENILRKEPSPEVKEFDFVVVGGGAAGICAATAAARQGLKTALVNDFEILGGNNSSLVRVHLGGTVCTGRYPNLGNLVKEFGHTRAGNAKTADYYEDSRKTDLIAAEKNITLYAPYHFIRANMNGNSIGSVIVRHNMTGEILELKAQVFADCSGDGNLGASAGADFMYGRESRDEYGESSAPEKADRMVLGASIQWNTEETADTAAFPEFVYGLEFDSSKVEKTPYGEWTWETGMNRDMITEAERVRDYGMLVAYSNWSYLKNHTDAFPQRRLAWVSNVIGKRESRRLKGDIVLTEYDIRGMKWYPDGSAATTWSIDLHYPDPKNAADFPNEPFKSYCTQRPIEPYDIPYRCLYSRNIDNLFMAGRCISVTHIALGTTRVMRTCAMEGEVVGLAASVCISRYTTPRGVYTYNFCDLQKLMEKGAGDPNAPDTQNFNAK